MMTQQRFALALFFMALSIFSSAGGLLNIPVICLYYLAMKNWKKFFIVTTYSLFLIFVYFKLFHYSHPAQHPDLFIAIKAPLNFIFFVFAVFGSFGMLKVIGIISAIFFGALSVTLFAIKIKFIHKTLPFLFWLSVYLFITILSVGISRVGFGLEYSQSSRYSIFAILFLVILYMAYFDIFKNTRHRTVFYTCSLIFSVVLFSYWYPRGSSSLNQLSIDLSQKVLRYPDQGHATNVINKSKELGIFNSSWLDD
jgi:hypothetical protein